MTRALWGGTGLLAIGALAVPELAAACDWDPTGVCGGRRWHVWSGEIRLLVAGGSALSLLAALVAIVALARFPRRRGAMATMATVGLFGAMGLIGHATKWSNWPAGRPANAPSWAPE